MSCMAGAVEQSLAMERDDSSCQMFGSSRSVMAVDSWEFSLQLSEKEMRGSLMTYVQWVSQIPSTHENVDDENVIERQSTNILKLQNSKGSDLGWCLECEDGPNSNIHVSGDNNMGLAIVAWDEPSSICLYDNGVAMSTEGLSDIMKKRPSGVKCKKPKRKMRKSKRRVNKMIYGDKALMDDVPESSISDEEIGNRNKIILREAEANVEVSSILGFDFLRSQVQLVEAFDVLGVEDSRRE
ncbi:hypothetical protein PTKIN_Ptkin06aG0130200 [Pterospermum kingtungense]